MTPLFPLCTSRGYYSPLMELDPLRSGYSNLIPTYITYTGIQTTRSGSSHPSLSRSSTTSTESTANEIECSPFRDRFETTQIPTERYRFCYAIPVPLPRYTPGTLSRPSGELSRSASILIVWRSVIVRCYRWGRWIVRLFAEALKQHRRG